MKFAYLTHFWAPKFYNFAHIKISPFFCKGLSRLGSMYRLTIVINSFLVIVEGQHRKMFVSIFLEFFCLPLAEYYFSVTTAHPFRFDDHRQLKIKRIKT